MSIPDWFETVGLMIRDGNSMHLYCSKCENGLHVTYLPDEDPTFPHFRVICEHCHEPDGVYKFDGIVDL